MERALYLKEKDTVRKFPDGSERAEMGCASKEKHGLCLDNIESLPSKFYLYSLL